MQIAALWLEGERFFHRDLLYAAKDRFLRLAEEGVEPDRSWNAVGLTAMRLRDFTLAETCLRRALEAAHATADHRAALKAQINLTLLRVRTGEVQEALAASSQAESMVHAADDPALRANALAAAALAHALVYDWQQALDRTEAALLGAGEVADAALEAWMVLYRGVYQYELGWTQDAQLSLFRALDMARRDENAFVEARACTELARVYVTQGDWNAAVHYGKVAIESLWLKTGEADKAQVARLCELFGRLALAMDDHRPGSTLLERASTYYAQLNSWRDWGRISELIYSGGVGRLARPEGLDQEVRETLEWFADLFGLLDTIEGADPSLFCTGQMVTHYALRLLDFLGLPPEQRAVISNAGRLSDIGLTTFEPAAIENETGQRYRLHPELGERWLADFRLPPGTPAAVRAHHEHFDGTGYPDGLRGEEIPLASRLLAVCEEYVRAMQDGRSHDQALTGLTDLAGTLLDPALAAAFVALHGETPAERRV